MHAFLHMWRYTELTCSVNLHYESTYYIHVHDSTCNVYVHVCTCTSINFSELSECSHWKPINYTTWRVSSFNFSSNLLSCAHPESVMCSASHAYRSVQSSSLLTCIHGHAFWTRHPKRYITRFWKFCTSRASRQFNLQNLSPTISKVYIFWKEISWGIQIWHSIWYRVRY